MEHRLQTLTVRGSFHGPTGHDHHVREFVRELYRQGVRTELVDLPFWSPARLPEIHRDPWFDSLTAPCDSRSELHFCMPHQVARTPGKINANFTMFGANRIPAAWVAQNRKVELVILPTKSSRQTWNDSGFPAHRIRLCPLGIDPEKFSGTIRPLPLQLETCAVANYRTRILNVSEVSPRKNLIGLLAAWTLATSSRDDGVLILKIGCYENGALNPFWHKIRVMEESLGKRLTDAAPILVLTETLSDEDMRALYSTALTTSVCRSERVGTWR